MIHSAGARPRSVERGALLRRRGDRRGFEPLDPGALDNPPRFPMNWPCGGRSHRVWFGTPVDHLLVDGTRGGLGDLVRTLVVAAAGLRHGLVRRVTVQLNPGSAADWVRATTVLGVAIGDAPATDAVLPPLFHLVDQCWPEPPRAPLTALAAAALRIPLDRLAGPVLEPLEPLDLPRPVVALQADGPVHGPEDVRVLRREKVPGAVLQSVGEAIEHPVWIGSPGPPASRGTDLRGCDLIELTRAIGSADLLVCADSGPLHLAAVLGVPTVAVFGPSDPAIHNCAANAVVVQPRGWCDRLPCGAGSLVGGPTDAGNLLPLPCPPAGGCLRGMDPADVLRVVTVVLDAVTRPTPRG